MYNPAVPTLSSPGSVAVGTWYGVGMWWVATLPVSVEFSYLLGCRAAVQPLCYMALPDNVELVYNDVQSSNAMLGLCIKWVMGFIPHCHTPLRRTSCKGLERRPLPVFVRYHAVQPTLCFPVILSI